VTGPEDERTPVKVPGKETLTAPLPKRFYKGVSVAPATPGPGFAILLDGRPVRTPKKLPLVVPTERLADAIVAEWQAQGEHIDPATMPLSKLAITTIDGVAAHAADVAADIVKFAGSDLLSYRAEAPAELTVNQSHAWDPILHWAETELGAHFDAGVGVMPVAQRRQALDKIAGVVKQFAPFELAALHVMTTLTGSALLALAHAKGRLSAAEAWAAAHVDEDWQISQWGEDAEAAIRRARRWAEMLAASRFLGLLTKAN
jgi:chaperone required for assembly of F1-ATPase